MKIAILGCDGSHAEAYALLLAPHVVSFWDASSSHAKSKHALVPKAKAYEDLTAAVQECDLAMVVGRYADSHFSPASVALALGKRVYIDKPGLTSLAQARELSRMADEKKIALCGFSPFVLDSNFIRFQERWVRAQHFVVACPAFCLGITEPGANDLSFYASHATDLLCHLNSSQPTSARTHIDATGIWVDVTFQDGRHGALQLPFKAEEFYHVTAYQGAEVETIHLDPWGDMYENTARFVSANLANLEWAKGQFDRSLHGHWLMDEIKRLAGEHAWKK
jgi:hypothetical protein